MTEDRQITNPDERAAALWKQLVNNDDAADLISQDAAGYAAAMALAYLYQDWERRLAEATWDTCSRELTAVIRTLRDFEKQNFEKQDEALAFFQTIVCAADGVEPVICKFCRQPTDPRTAHAHSGDTGWVGDACCWDERLRSTD